MASAASKSAAAVPVLWRPNPGPQTRFLASDAYEVLYGGAAGGGKTAALVAGALRYAHVPGYTAIILRRTFPELDKSVIKQANPLIARAYPDAAYNESKKRWRFASGAELYFASCEHDKDVHKLQGAELQYAAFDEATHFSEYIYRYILSRLRTTSRDVPLRVRAASNPGGPGAEFFINRFAPWLDRRPSYKGPLAEPGQRMWYRNGPDGEEWTSRDDPDALSRVFIPAKLADNPHLDADYLKRLRGLGALERAQLIDGDWMATPGAGKVFKRAWFTSFLDHDERPAPVVKSVRYWDRAGSRHGDYTVGVRADALDDDTFVVADVERFRGTPGEVEARILAVAEGDGPRVRVVLEQDPGQAGKYEVDSYIKKLAGFNARAVRPTGDKLTRAMPASAQCEAGNVRVVRAGWNGEFFRELEAFPEGSHDDQVDALSGALGQLFSKGGGEYVSGVGHRRR